MDKDQGWNLNTAKKCDFTMALTEVGARWVGLSISETDKSTHQTWIAED